MSGMSARSPPLQMWVFSLLQRCAKSLSRKVTDALALVKYQTFDVEPRRLRLQAHDKQKWSHMVVWVDSSVLVRRPTSLVCFQEGGFPFTAKRHVAHIPACDLFGERMGT